MAAANDYRHDSPGVRWVAIEDGTGDAGLFTLPAGTVTLLLADVEGSTRAWAADAAGMNAAMAVLDRVVSDVVGVHGGVRPVEQGEGDSFVAAFDRPSAALRAAAAIQRALAAGTTDESTPGLQLRIGVHTGEVAVRDGRRYMGIALSRCARLRDCGHGGQTLVSGATAALASDGLPDGLALVPLGHHRLADLSRPEHIHQLSDSEHPADFPPLRALDHTPNNLPVQLTSFVGREAELLALRDLLSQQRLVTLTGAGGSGKTRLALQLAASRVDHHDAVWFVDLSSLRSAHPAADLDAILAAVGAAIGVAAAPNEPVAAAIEARLRASSALLVLDNCEQIVDAAAAAAEFLLQAGRGVVVVATSREPLGALGEHTFAVPTLSVRAAGEDEPLGPAALRSDEAITLFVERARQVRPTFEMTEENRSPVERICKRLDGIPLAIELAAARVRVLTPERIADELDDRFRLLTGGPRTAVSRQSTLRSSIDWSHDLLSLQERAVFRRLGVLAGPFTVQDAEVLAAGPIDGSGDEIGRWDVFDQLARLVERSMIVMVDGAASEPRYRSLETLRAYALDRLTQSGELDAVERAYVARMADVVREFAPLHGSQLAVPDASWRMADMESALRTAHDRGMAEYAIIASYLADLISRRWPGRARELAREAVAAIEAANSPPFGEPWMVATIELMRRGVGEDTPLHVARLQENVSLLRASGHTDAALDTASAWVDIFACAIAGYADAAPLQAAALHARATGNRRLLAGALVHLTLAARALGDLDVMRDSARERVELLADDTGGLDGAIDTVFYLLALGLIDAAETVARSAEQAQSAYGRLWAFEALCQVGFHREDRGILAEAHQALLALAPTAPMAGAAASHAATLLSCLDPGAPGGSGPPPRLATELQRVASDVLVLALSDTPERALDHIVDDAPPHSPEGIFRASLRPFVLRRIGRPAEAAAALAHAIAERRDRPGLAWIDILSEAAALTLDHGDPKDAARILGISARRRSEAGIRVGWVPSRFHTHVAERLASGYEACVGEGAALDEPDAVGFVAGVVDGLVAALRGSDRPAFGWESLTPAERRVVDLIVEGKTNREAAAELGVQPSTVHTHLLHVYGKLGIGSRAELATERARHEGPGRA